MAHFSQLIYLSAFLYISYKCVECQDNLASQGPQAPNVSQVLPVADNQAPPEQPQADTGPIESTNPPNEDVVDRAHTLEGNVLQENPVERLKALAKDVSREISANPYYKIPALTRKIREIAVMHPDLMEKLGVYVIPVPEEAKADETTEENVGLTAEESKEVKKEDMRSEIEELMEKTGILHYILPEMLKAMTPEQKLEYIPKLKETVVYQIVKNNELLNKLAGQTHHHISQEPRQAQSQEEQEAYQGYPYGQEYQGYEGYPNYQEYGYYPGYGYPQDYQNYQGGYYQNYPDYQNYQNYAY